jgi:hypothetical protein
MTAVAAAAAPPWRWALGACTRPSLERFLDVFDADEADPEAVRIAKAICHRCPVRADCRSWAEQERPEGIWAGETWAERTHRLGRRGGRR